MKFIEKSVFLRPLNYLRVRHEYAVRFNLIVPTAATTLFTLLLFRLSVDPDIYGHNGLIAGFTQMLGVLAPFFIASLAAVATFSANKLFDTKFRMKETLSLERLEKGTWRTRLLTVRQFLSLLFGYCGFVSLMLFLTSLIVPVIAPGISLLFGDWSQVFGLMFFVFYLFVFFHMMTATIIGIYYLSDRIHRE